LVGDWYGVTALEQGVRDDGERQSGVPEVIEPNRRIDACSEQPRFRKRAGKRQGMRDDNQSSEEVTGRERQQGRRAYHRNLREEQRRRDQIAQQKGRIDDRNERRNR
jgi:hypothetical protein